VAVATVTAGAAVAMLLATGNATQADVDDPLVLGRSNWSEQTTYLNWHRKTYPMPYTGLAVVGQQAGAVFATNEEYAGTTDPGWIDGIRAVGNDRGGYFYGVNYGAVASSSQVGLLADAADVGVEASGDTAVKAAGSDVGLVAEGPVAIQAQGAVTFSSAGLVTVPLGASSAVVTPGTDVIKSSMVLATAQTRGGQVLRVTRNTTADTVRIHLAAPASQPVQVAYFVIG